MPSPGWAVLTLSVFFHRRDVPVPQTSLWPFGGPSPIAPCLFCTVECRIGPRTPDVASRDHLIIPAGSWGTMILHQHFLFQVLKLIWCVCVCLGIFCYWGNVQKWDYQQWTEAKNVRTGDIKDLTCGTSGRNEETQCCQQVRHSHPGAIDCISWQSPSLPVHVVPEFFHNPYCVHLGNSYFASFGFVYFLILPFFFNLSGKPRETALLPKCFLRMVIFKNCLYTRENLYIYT